MSLAAIFLGLAWVVRGEYKVRLKKLLHKKAALLTMSLFLIHALGMIHTDDVGWGMNDLRIKLPLLLIPFILGSMPQIGNMAVTRYMWLFVAAVLFSTLYSFLVYLEIFPSKRDLSDPRNISAFISHVRLSLLVVFSILFLLYRIWKEKSNQVKYIAAAIILWLIYFLFLLQSFTGLLILGIGLPVAAVYVAIRSPYKWMRWSISVILVVSISISAVFIQDAVSGHYHARESLDNLPSHTPYGEPYAHYKHVKVLENGHYIWVNIAFTELKETWNARSRIPINSNNLQGGPIFSTVVRYLTSKGLRKDRDGVLALEQRDIERIENGVATARSREGSIRSKIDDLLFEIDVYLHDGDPSGHSVTQRLEFWKTAWYIIQKNPMGVGTGDANLAFEDAYTKNDSKLRLEFRLRSHNQFLAVCVSLGIVGGIWFLLALIIPIFITRKRIDFYYIAFFTVSVLSFFWEDTLETQAGVTFFAFFQTLFLVGRDESSRD